MSSENVIDKGEQEENRVAPQADGETEYEMLTREMEQNFYETMKSIKKYGGYYIGRYETGIEVRTSINRTNINRTNGGNTIVRKTQYNNYNINYQSWYEAYAKNRELAGRNENVKTSMIWGNMWEWTLEANYIIYRVGRGGSYVNSSYGSPASYRNNSYPGYGNGVNIGSRAMLIIK